MTEAEENRVTGAMLDFPFTAEDAAGQEIELTQLSEFLYRFSFGNCPRTTIDFYPATALTVPKLTVAPKILHDVFLQIHDLIEKNRDVMSRILPSDEQHLVGTE